MQLTDREVSLTWGSMRLGFRENVERKALDGRDETTKRVRSNSYTLEYENVRPERGSDRGGNVVHFKENLPSGR